MPAGEIKDTMEIIVWGIPDPGEEKEFFDPDIRLCTGFDAIGRAYSVKAKLTDIRGISHDGEWIYKAPENEEQNYHQAHTAWFQINDDMSFTR